MTFEIEIDGQTRAVSVERAGQGSASVQGASTFAEATADKLARPRPGSTSEGGRYRVVVDGRPYLVDAARIGQFGLSLLLQEQQTVSREVQVAPTGRQGELLAVLDGRTVSVTLNGRRSRRHGADAAGSAAGEQSIVAPMPGRIVRVLVAPGDEVAARQPVVVVEAMKMENELRSPKAGAVKEVTVSAGMSVEAGRVLVTIV